MIRLLLSSLAGTGVTLIVADRHRPARSARPRRRRPTHLVGAVLTAAAVAATTWALLGSPIVAAVAAGGSVLLPRSVAARERRRRAERLCDAWPRLLDEARVLCGPGGRSLPQALFAAGRAAPPELRRAWADGRRVWGLSADLDAALAAVQARLDDPTTAIVCPTLAILHDAGGTAQQEQLARLIDDRRRDSATRRRAEAELAGARFSRRFVIVVPVAMALAGQSVGTGRAAFASPAGQVAALTAVGVTAACWYWSGRLLALPTLPGAPA